MQILILTSCSALTMGIAVQVNPSETPIPSSTVNSTKTPSPSNTPQPTIAPSIKPTIKPTETLKLNVFSIDPIKLPVNSLRTPGAYCTILWKVFQGCNKKDFLLAKVIEILMI